MTMSESDFAYESENFNVTFNVTPGELKINKRTLTLTSASDEKEYDGTPLTNDTVTVDGELAETDDIEFTVTGKQIEAGSSPNYFTYQFVKKGGAEVEGSALAKAMSAFATVSAADASGDIAANYNIDVNYGISILAIIKISWRRSAASTTSTVPNLTVWLVIHSR